ncbi:Mediator complex, subunit Med11 [Pseudohyphozyma bogoriensis]|nr:Mediator complex, subunit Med11 [Pseudohyphozyma bogoriensis]
MDYGSDSGAEAGPSGTRNGEPKLEDGDGEGWKQTRSGKRILELKDVEEQISQLLHFAGCTVASLHPDPLSSFTSRTVDFQDASEAGSPAPTADPEDKMTQFSNYAEAYYTTLNDIQLALRTSIRHLRVAKASPAPLLDPSFGSLATPGGGGVAVGGVAMGDSLKPVQPLGQGEGQKATNKSRGDGTSEPKMSVAALELEKEAWEALASALEREKQAE